MISLPAWQEERLALEPGESAFPELWKGGLGLWLPGTHTGNVCPNYFGAMSPGADGTLTSMDASTDWVPTARGWALAFDGTDDHVDIADSFAPTTELTLMCRVYRQWSGDPWHTIIGKGENVNGSAGWWLRGHGADNSVTGTAFTNGGNKREIKGTVTWPSSTWMHGAMRIKDALLEVYADGVQVGSVAAPGTIDNDTGVNSDFCDANTGDNAHCQCLLCDVRFYARALTDQEIYRSANDWTYHPLTPRRTTTVALPPAAPAGSILPLLNHYLSG